MSCDRRGFDVLPSSARRPGYQGGPRYQFQAAVVRLHVCRGPDGTPKVWTGRGRGRYAATPRVRRGVTRVLLPLPDGRRGVAEALTACFDLLADSRAAGRARRLVTELLTAWNRGEDADVARLLVSEVVTNAVRYVGARHALRLKVVADERRMRIAVVDGSVHVPRLRDAADTDESGRGMHLVAALASEWGVADGDQPDVPGKSVWFDLPTQPGVAPAPCRQG